MIEQLTFTEDEAKQHADFINMVYTKAKWDLTSAEAMTLSKHFGQMSAFQKKVDAHIMEVKSITVPKTKKAKK